MRSLFLLSLFLPGLHPSLAFGADVAPPAYLDKFVVEAARALHARAGKDPTTLKADADKEDWVAARLAWIALARLQAKEGEALNVFRGCQKLCGKYGAAGEWKAAKAWGCGKDPRAAPCGD